MINLKVICINDKNKPDGIPTSKWLVEGSVYTVIQVTKLLIQGGMLGYKLAELNIDDCFPYQYFAASRFILLGSPSEQWAEDELSRILEEAVNEETQKSIKLGAT